MTQTIKKTTISAPASLIEEAQAKAKAEDLNFSQYCRKLIKANLEEEEEEEAATQQPIPEPPAEQPSQP